VTRSGGYDAQQGGIGGGGVWVTDEQGRLKPDVEDVWKLVAEHNAILSTSHLSPREIVALVMRARELGVERMSKSPELVARSRA